MFEIVVMLFLTLIAVIMIVSAVFCVCWCCCSENSKDIGDVWGKPCNKSSSALSNKGYRGPQSSAFTSVLCTPSDAILYISTNSSEVDSGSNSNYSNCNKNDSCGFGTEV